MYQLTDKDILQIESEFVGNGIKRYFYIYWQKLCTLQPSNELITVDVCIFYYTIFLAKLVLLESSELVKE